MALLIAFLYYSFFIEKKSETDEAELNEFTLPMSILFIVGGSIGLFFGGKWIVSGATQIAYDFGVSDTFVGLTIVAVATSLPELVTSILAALKKNTALAIGNAVGSNVFNLLLVLGSSSIITSIPFNMSLNMELGILITAGLLVILFIRVDFGKQKMAVSRIEGIFLILAYLCYFIFLMQDQIL